MAVGVHIWVKVSQVGAGQEQPVVRVTPKTHCTKNAKNQHPELPVGMCASSKCGPSKVPGALRLRSALC